MNQKNREELFEQIKEIDYILEHWQQKNGEPAQIHGNDSTRYRKALKIKFSLVNKYLGSVEPNIEK